MIGARSRSTRCTAPSSSLSVRVQSSSTSATATSSATAKVRSRSENRSPPPSASEPTAAPATTRGSLSARARTRSRNASRCATVNIDKQDDGMTADLTTLLARASVHASLIEGGVELSSYPAHCKLGLERRTLPGETGRQIEAELAGLLERCREADPEFEASHRILLVREPFEINQDQELVALVAQAAADVLGEPAT